MRLPKGEDAFVDQAKVDGYLLSPVHPVGRHKARVFAAALGLGPGDSAILIAELRVAAATGEAVLTRSDEYGSLWRIEQDMRFGSRAATVRSLWLAPPDGPPFLVTAFVV